MFRRKKGKGDEADAQPTEDPTATTRESGSADGEGERERPAATATSGPYDDADAPDDGLGRIDLGGLRVPVPEGVEVRVDVSPEGQVVAATAVRGPSQLQINAFAAPRDGGIWDDVRTEIAGALRGQGGTAEEVPGPFGPELRARIPTGQPSATQPARFLGVDGPRWFVRGLLTGPASTDAGAAAPLLDVFRDIVVVRGKDAMAPRDPLPLTLPREAREAAAAAQEEAEGEQGRRPTQDDLDPFHRGPEITEVR